MKLLAPATPPTHKPRIELPGHGDRSLHRGNDNDPLARARFRLVLRRSGSAGDGDVESYEGARKLLTMS